MEEKYFRQLLEKYTEGRCTPEEIAQLHRWYDSFQLTDQPAVTDQQEYTRRQESMLAAIGQKTGTRFRPAVRNYRLWKYTAAAACVLVICGIALFWVIDRSGAGKTSGTVWSQVQNDQNNIRQVTLPDSSLIWLNKGAAIAWNNQYGVQTREIRLTGEAYFDVRKNAGRPFLILTEHLTTRVLGTAFNVEAYPGEKEIKIALVKGRVAVYNHRDTLLLQPGSMAVFNKTSEQLDREMIAAADVSAWTRNKIVFNETPLSDVLSRLQNLYNTRLTYDSTRLHQFRLTGEFNKDSLEDVLGSVLAIHRLKYKKTGVSYTIYP